MGNSIWNHLPAPRATALHYDRRDESRIRVLVGWARKRNREAVYMSYWQRRADTSDGRDSYL